MSERKGSNWSKGLILSKEDTFYAANTFKKYYEQFEHITDYFKEVKKERIELKSITNQKAKDILKKLGYNKYYEHIPHIINVITGKSTPYLTRKNEEQLRIMFKDIQTPFQNNCPDGRKNFLSYNYVLHKFCQLLQHQYDCPEDQ